jgi:hypothetical protein
LYLVLILNCTWYKYSIVLNTNTKLCPKRVQNNVPNVSQTCSTSIQTNSQKCRKVSQKCPTCVPNVSQQSLESIPNVSPKCPQSVTHVSQKYPESIPTVSRCGGVVLFWGAPPSKPPNLICSAPQTPRPARRMNIFEFLVRQMLNSSFFAFVVRQASNLVPGAPSGRRGTAGEPPGGASGAPRKRGGTSRGRPRGAEEPPVIAPGGLHLLITYPERTLKAIQIQDQVAELEHQEMGI